MAVLENFEGLCGPIHGPRLHGCECPSQRCLPRDAGHTVMEPTASCGGTSGTPECGDIQLDCAGVLYRSTAVTPTRRWSPLHAPPCSRMRVPAAEVAARAAAAASQPLRQPVATAGCRTRAQRRTSMWRLLWRQAPCFASRAGLNLGALELHPPMGSTQPQHGARGAYGLRRPPEKAKRCAMLRHEHRLRSSGRQELVSASKQA